MPRAKTAKATPKLEPKPTKKPFWLAVIIIVIFIALGSGGYFLVKTRANQETTNYKQATFGAQVPENWNIATSDVGRPENFLGKEWVKAYATFLFEGWFGQSNPRPTPLLVASHDTICFLGNKSCDYNANDIQIYQVTGNDIKQASKELKDTKTIPDSWWSDETINGQKFDVITNLESRDPKYGSKIYLLTWQPKAIDQPTSYDAGLLIYATKNNQSVADYFLNSLKLPKTDSDGWPKIPSQ